ncbi:uncharacterized protein [Rutidosis leptorrhynchoides]|uniref:uncharacterized protein n=1 Tax=Rutidosis leptorrhynchoides TaxID=125765 RepID=UPI003A994789
MRGYTCWTFHGESLADLNPFVSDNDTNNEEDSYNSDNNFNIDDMFDDLDMEDNVADKYKRGKPTDNVDSDVSKNGPPAKLLWYLPIIPRLKRLFTNEKDEKLLCWHAEDRKNDGKMRHVADSLQWKNIDKDFGEFGDEIRNIRFRLSSDGINPFGDLSSRHSTWPVLLCIYNLPPWLCMKRKYIMMSILIQGPKQPGNDIDVYLQPLVDDMMELWSIGIHVYDAYKKEYFQLRAMHFCTINDFPDYGNLFGYSTKGKKACPICEENTHSIWLTNCKKPAFMGHWRELAENHLYRKKSDLFDGTIEDRKLPPPLDGETTLSKVANINVVLGKKGFGPPKGLLLSIPGKTKDGIKVRRDMELMNIRPELQHKDINGRATKFLPPACYTMSKVEKTKFCRCLYCIKVPSGYSANIRKLVSIKDLKLLGMKSHDCDVIDPVVLDEYQRDIILTLCELKMYFPPSFFDVIVHLKGSIVEGYASEEVIEFCTNYMDGFKSVGILQSCHEGRLSGQGTHRRKTGYSNVSDYQEAHFTVLQHTTSIDPYIQVHMSLLRQENQWLKDKVKRTLPNIDKTVEALGFAPKHVFQYQGYDINGYTFYTKDQDKKSKTQNSGVTVIASSTEFTMVNREERSRITKKSYYGVIQEIW